VNFLAHLYLAAPTDELLVGNLMGDFVKGRPESLVGKFPDEVILGIRQHRAIDVSSGEILARAASEAPGWNRGGYILRLLPFAELAR
jgi:acyl carrier protein phosphodiesterase